MSGLSSIEIHAFNEAALVLHATRNAADLSEHIYKAVRTIIRGDIVVVDWVNPKTSVSLLCEYFPRGAVSVDLNALGHILLPQQLPYWLNCSDDPHSISDFMTRNRWTKVDFFWAMHEVDQEECLCVDIPLSPTLTLMVVDMRSTFGSHTSSERQQLKLLRPHIRQVYRRLAAQGHLKTEAFVQRRAQVDIDGAGERFHWSREARELLAAQGVLVLDDDLPGSVKSWFLAQRLALDQPSEVTPGVHALTFRRGTKILTLYLIRKPEGQAYWLILEEKEIASAANRTFPDLDITRRESEVLFWVSQGKSNPEIATILGISGGTVSRHLENIFPKLGVDNRYAASAIASNILSAKEKAAVPARGA